MKDMIQKKLDQYNATSEQEEENALKEITQEVALYALSKSGFFEQACFHGGTCLRIVHGIDRFSEDLDFALNTCNVEFDLSSYLDKCSEMMKLFGYGMEIVGKDKTDSYVRKRFLKDESIKNILSFHHLSNLKKKIQIKVEVDVNPPEGADLERKYLEFPTDYSIATHDLPSLFSGKLHALLCREYVKGRDWYDFSWYVSQKIVPNYGLLKNALEQQGPWVKKNVSVNASWLVDSLSDKIRSINWAEASADISPFLKLDKHNEVRKLWSEEFFLTKTAKLVGLK